MKRARNIPDWLAYLILGAVGWSIVIAIGYAIWSRNDWWLLVAAPGTLFYIRFMTLK